MATGERCEDGPRVVQIAQMARELVALQTEALADWLGSGLLARFVRPRSRAMATLAERLERLDSGQLSGLDGEVRDLSPRGDGGAGWTPATRTRIGELARFREGWATLGLLTFHRDGHVRQAALLALCSRPTPRALPFVLLRLNDWVPEVRRAAKAALPSQLMRENADAVVAALPLILALETKGRDDHQPTIEAARRLLGGAEGREALRRGADSSDPRVRAACYRFLFDPEGADEEILRKALRDPSPTLRLAALRAAGRRRPMSLSLVEWARADSFLPVRREAFRLLLDVSPARAEQEIREALVDRSTGLRWEAAYAYWQRNKERAVKVYRGAVAAETGRRQVSAVLGLGEHGDTTDVGLLIPFLSSARVGLRRAAVRGLARLDSEGQTDRLMTALEDPSPGVSTEARRALMRTALPSSAADRVEALVANGSTPWNIRRNALDVLAGAGKWRAIPGLVRACGAPDARLAEVARERVRGWLARYNSSFAQPSAADIAALTMALALAGARARLGDRTCRELDMIASALGT